MVGWSTLTRHGGAVARGAAWSAGAPQLRLRLVNGPIECSGRRRVGPRRREAPVVDEVAAALRPISFCPVEVLVCRRVETAGGTPVGPLRLKRLLEVGRGSLLGAVGRAISPMRRTTAHRWGARPQHFEPTSRGRGGGAAAVSGHEGLSPALSCVQVRRCQFASGADRPGASRPCWITHRTACARELTPMRR